MERRGAGPAALTQRRGRGREEATAAILDAALGLLAEGGHAAMTTDAIAARARVSKQTVYQRWPTKDALVVAAVNHLDNAPAAPDTGSLLGDLRSLLGSLGDRLASSDVLDALAPLLPARKVSADLDAAVGGLLRQLRAPFVKVVRRGARRGELPRGTDVDAVVDSLLGAVVLRQLFLRARVDRKSIDALLRQVLGPASV